MRRRAVGFSWWPERRNADLNGDDEEGRICRSGVDGSRGVRPAGERIQPEVNGFRRENQRGYSGGGAGSAETAAPVRRRCRATKIVTTDNPTTASVSAPSTLAGAPRR